MAQETNIKDGDSGSIAHVDKNKQLHGFSVTESEQRQAALLGNEFNINTGTIALTGSGDSALIYFKNDEDTSYLITGLAIGMGTRSATITDAANVTIIRNPTGGDVISDASAVAMKSNANFGSNKTLKTTTLAYKGKDGGTVTGGDTHALLYMTDGRLFASLNVVLEKGASIGVKIDLNTSGGANIYCALLGYVKDEKNT
jgi:hypothetical protein